MRELITHYSDALRPDYWICNQCGQLFHMSVDDVTPSSHFPPVHTWVEFEQHECDLRPDVAYRMASLPPAVT